MADKRFTYLALGDSYTVGEAVPIYESFPYQAVQLLRQKGFDFHAAEIVAKTGWTTSELGAGIRHHIFLPAYNIVSLLIGVNNQYRNEEIKHYSIDFELPLQQAISFAGGAREHVFVLSIPDWSVTSFARGALPDKHGRTAQQVSAGIDSYNQLNKSIAEKYGAHYIDITPGTRQSANDESLLAADELHPSGKEYGRWAAVFANLVMQVIGDK